MDDSESATMSPRPRRPVWLLGALVLTAVAIATIFATSPTDDARSTRRVPTVAAEVRSLIDGIPQHANVLGGPDAPVRMLYFGDLKCPYCRKFTLGALPSIIQKWVRTGALSIEYRSKQTATRGLASFRRQQAAALAAGIQDKMWYFLELFYREQQDENAEYVTEAYLQGLARQVPGLDFARWIRDRRNPELSRRVDEDNRLAERIGVIATPSLFIGRNKGAMRAYPLESLSDPSGLDAVIAGLLGG